MTKRQVKAQQKQARHQRQIAQRLEKKRAIKVQAEAPDEEELDLEEDLELAGLETPEEEVESAEDSADEDDEPEEVEPVPVRKDYMGDMSMPSMSMGGPTSFDELDEQQAAQEQAQNVREETWNVQDLVRNIMGNPSFDTAAKSAAIQKVGSDFGDRVNAIMAGNEPGGSDGGDMGDMSKELDMDVLYTEALLAEDHRHLSWQEAMTDWLTKAKLSYAAKKAKGDSAYALVYTDKKGNKVRKYLIHDKAHVRNALARAAQQIKDGGVGAPDARRALPKIHAAAKRMGIGMGKSHDAVMVEKDAKGDWRWVGMASNNFIDWSGDIVRKSAHEEYVGYLDQHPDMAPLFMSWHTPGTERENPVDYWAFENGFLILSGKLTEPEAAGLLKAQKETDLGMSINGIAIHPKKDQHDIQLYRLIEVSDLPRENADNPFTAFSVVSKEVGDMDKQKYLAQILGSEEKAEAFIKKTGLMKEQLESAGVAQKEVAPAASAAPAAKAATAAAPDQQALVEAVLKELDVDGLNDFVTKAKEAIEKVPVLEGVIKELQGNQEQKLAELVNPPASRFAWASDKRASQSAENKITKQQAEELAPGLGDDWLSVATGTKPIDTTVVRQ